MGLNHYRAGSAILSVILFAGSAVFHSAQAETPPTGEAAAKPSVEDQIAALREAAAQARKDAKAAQESAERRRG